MRAVDSLMPSVHSDPDIDPSRGVFPRDVAAEKLASDQRVPIHRVPSRSFGWTALACVAWLLGPGLASAQIVSTSDEDPPPAGSLRAEVESAAAGSTIDVQLGTEGGDTSTIELRTVLPFESSVTIDNSSSAFSPMTIRSPDDGSLFEIDDGVSVILRDVGLEANGQNNSDDINLLGPGSSLTFDISRGDQTVSSDIFGSGSLIKEGTSALTFSGFNTFDGGLTIREGDVIGDGVAFDTPFIDLAAGGGMTARVVYDISGSDFLDDTSPMITNGSTGGGRAEFVKRGSGILDASRGFVAGSIGVVIEEGELIADEVFLANGNSFDIAEDSQLTARIGIAAPTIPGAISGSGTFRSEANLLTISGDLSNFTGMLDVSGGSTLIGEVTIDPASAPSSPLSFDIALETGFVGLRFVDDVGITLSGDVSGTGNFTKTGSGTTELTGSSSGTYQTFVESGALNGNTDNLRGVISVTAGAAIGFRQAANGDFDGRIGSGGPITVRKFEAGRLTLLQSQLFTGSFNVDAGGLNFAPGTELTNANLTIGSASSTRTSLTADFTPGGDNSVDIGGSLTFLSDARLEIDLDEVGGSSTRFTAGGAVIIDPAAELELRLQSGTYAGSPTFDILTGSSVTGDFTIVQNLFFFDIVGGTNGGAYQVTLNPSLSSFSSAATSSNQLAVSGPLDVFRSGPSGGDPEIEEIQGALTVAESSDVGNILDSVSPDDLAASTNTSLAAAARTWRSLSNRLALHRKQSIGHHNTRKGRRAKARRERAERINERRRRTRRPSVDAAAPTDLDRTQKPWVAWAEADGALGEIDSQDAKAYDYRLVGPLLGADTALIETVRVGFATGYTYSMYETTGQNDSEGDANSVEGVVYGAWLGEPFEALIAARYAHSWSETERRIETGTISSNADGDFEGDIFGFYTELTRGFDFSLEIEDSTPLEIDLAPLLSVAYSHVMWDSFDESGSNPLRLRVEDSEVDSAVTSLGFRVATEREMDQGILIRPRFKAVWNHEWADVEREITGIFASASVTGGSRFTVEGAEVPRDHAEISAGWEIAFRKNANLFIDWDGRFGSDLIENSLSVGGRITW